MEPCCKVLHFFTKISQIKTKIKIIINAIIVALYNAIIIIAFNTMIINAITVCT